MGVPLNNSKVQKMFWKNVLGNFETVTIKCKISLERTNRKKKKKMFTRSISDFEMKIWIYWSESKSWLYIYISIYLYILKNWKNWKIEKIEKLTGPNEVLLVLGRRTDAHREDCHFFCIHSCDLLYFFHQYLLNFTAFS